MNERKLGGIYAVENKKLRLELIDLNSHGKPCDTLDKFKNEVFNLVEPRSDGHKHRYVVCGLPMVYDFDLEDEAGVASAVDAAKANIGLILEGWTTIVWDRYSGRMYSFEQDEYIYDPLDKLIDDGRLRAQEAVLNELSRGIEAAACECRNLIQTAKLETEALVQAAREGGMPNLPAAERQLKKSIDQALSAIDNMTKRTLGISPTHNVPPCHSNSVRSEGAAKSSLSKTELAESYDKLRSDRRLENMIENKEVVLLRRTPKMTDAPSKASKELKNFESSNYKNNNDEILEVFKSNIVKGLQDAANDGCCVELILYGGDSLFYDDPKGFDSGLPSVDREGYVTLMRSNNDGSSWRYSFVYPIAKISNDNLPNRLTRPCVVGFRKISDPK